MLRLRLVAASAALVLPAAFAPTASAETFAAVDSKNRLYTFGDSEPGNFKRVALKGLASGERIVGLDVRPANRQLVAVTNQSRLYTVSLPSARSRRSARHR